MSIVSITGHRELTKGDIGLIIQTVAELVRDPTVDAIYFGGALGADTIALRTAIKLRKDKHPRLVVVLPNKLASQPTTTWEWIKQADEVIELGIPITATDKFKSYTVRDQYLVDIATHLVAFYSGRRKSGTGKTVAMAERRGIPVRVVKVKSV